MYHVHIDNYDVTPISSYVGSLNFVLCTGFVNVWEVRAVWYSVVAEFSILHAWPTVVHVYTRIHGT